VRQQRRETYAGGDPGEGVPLETPDIARIDRSNPARCAVS